MKSIYQPFIDYFRKVNWMLLLFLVLFLNVKMLVKIAAIILLLLFSRKMFCEKTIYRQKFIWFYCSMIVIALINLLFAISSVSTNHLIAISVGIFFWLLCIAAAALSYWFVLKTESGKLHTTINFFFLLNAAVTIGQLLLIMWDAGSFNPYTYQGMYQKYFIGTGDLLTGISFDVSNTNALLNAFGIVYFLSRNRMHMVLLCMTMLLLTASNFTNILVIVALLFLFIFQSTQNQKSIILVCFFFLAIFMVKISPQNNHYVTNAFRKVFNKKGESPTEINTLTSGTADSTLNEDEKKHKIATLYLDSLKKSRMEKWLRENGITLNSLTGPSLINLNLVKSPVIPKANIHTKPYQRKRDTTIFQKKLLAFAIQTLQSFDTSLKQIRGRHVPGKLIAFEQTFQSLKKNPEKIIFGSGMGNFSSKLAFRTTGLQMAGSYSEKFTYISNDFLNNHLNLYLSYFSKDMELHSLINSPDSLYDQLIAEYGLAGIFSFILFYIGFFVKHIRKLTYGIPLLLIVLGAFGVGYWYEQLSVVILFELLMILNIKETKEQYG
jgi:hypothetical protein